MSSFSAGLRLTTYFDENSVPKTTVCALLTLLALSAPTRTETYQFVSQGSHLCILVNTCLNKIM